MRSSYINHHKKNQCEKFYLLNSLSSSNYFQMLYKITEGKLFTFSKKEKWYLHTPIKPGNKEMLKKQTDGSMPKGQSSQLKEFPMAKARIM